MDSNMQIEHLIGIIIIALLAYDVYLEYQMLQALQRGK